jgi:hypothetical protein
MCLIIFVAGLWRVFQKCGKPAWTSLVPIYHVVILHDITGNPNYRRAFQTSGAELLFYFVMLMGGYNPVNIIIIGHRLAKLCGKSWLFGLGLGFLPFVFYPILGFSDAQPKTIPQVPPESLVVSHMEIGAWLIAAWVFIAFVLLDLGFFRTHSCPVIFGFFLIPTLILVLAGLGRGLMVWPQAKRRMLGFVCRADCHRFTPGRPLGWLARWSGRWLWCENHPPEDMADSCVCRACGQTSPRYEGVREIIVVLDGHKAASPQQQDGFLRVNWLERKEAVDFDKAEIVNATDEEVEEFVRQTRYESDQLLQKRLPKMQCLVNAQCRFHRSNTMTILEQTFGKVTRE